MPKLGTACFVRSPLQMSASAAGHAAVQAVLAAPAGGSSRLLLVDVVKREQMCRRMTPGKPHSTLAPDV